MNPLLPDNCFMPDAEARVMPDGRLYLYGSWDISGNDNYCSRELHCFSTDDMETWVDHGAIFRNDDTFLGMPWAPESLLFAPDAIEKDGKYYLYVCGSHKEEGVAVANSPTGPFSHAERIDIADGDSIDPTVFVDSDGQGYLFWGQFSLRGARLSEDMRSIIPQSLTKGILTEWEHGFHEGASIRKRGDKYYLVYTDISRGKATCLSYAISSSPLGPYKKCGVIVDNIFCDPATWNNHGSIAQFKDKWYVFYHRSSQGRNTCRRVCAEPISFDENGFISEVKQTSQGACPAISAFSTIRARHACRMIGNCRIEEIDGNEVLVSKKGGHWRTPDWAEYLYIDFGNLESGSPLTFKASACGNGKLTLKIDGDKEITSVEINSSSFEKAFSLCKRVQGIHPLWIFLEGDLTIEYFLFEQ